MSVVLGIHFLILQQVFLFCLRIKLRSEHTPGPNSFLSHSFIEIQAIFYHSHLCKGYNSMDFGLEWCNPYHYLILEHLHHSTRKRHIHNSYFPFPHLLKPQQLIYILFPYLF